MSTAWAAARRLAAVVFVSAALAAVLVTVEDKAHVGNSFLHAVTVMGAIVLSVLVIHGLGALERIGF